MKTIERRGFLKVSAAGAASYAISATAKSYGAIKGANDRVNVGLVGFADRLKATLLPAFMASAKELNFEVVALSDIWRVRREEGVARLKEKYAKDVVACRNNDELYDRKDVDAVIIATSDFQHAMHCVEAVKAGRDVYVEKPLANKIADAKAVLKTVEASKQIVQIGTQRRSSPKYQRANDYIRSGKFGDVVAVEMTWNVNQPDRWRRPALVAQMK
jgi:predicted dehydrogenase